MKKIFFDGACLPKNPGGVACYGVVAVDDNGSIVDKRFGVVSENGTNNTAEWAGLIHAIKLAKELNWDGACIYGDSQLVVNQFNDLWRVSKKHLKRMYNLAKEESKEINIVVKWIPREENLANDVAYEAYVNYTKKISRNKAGVLSEEGKVEARGLSFSCGMSSCYGDVLCCPNCGYEYLRYTAIEIFDHEFEDSPYGLRYIIDGLEVRVNIGVTSKNQNKNGSCVRIKFLCENCGQSAWLRVLQHKGGAYIGWDSASFGEDRVSNKTTTNQTNKEVSHDDNRDKSVLDIFGK